MEASCNGYCLIEEHCITEPQMSMTSRSLCYIHKNVIIIKLYIYIFLSHGNEMIHMMNQST